MLRGILVAALIAVGLYFVTAGVYTEPLRNWEEIGRENMSAGVVDAGGFNPWTGQPEGMLLQQPGSIFRVPPDPAIRERFAVPVPIGFAIGLVVVLIVSSYRRSSSRRWL